MSEGPDVQVRRIYDDAADDDGLRVLVDRRWPRGITKDRADLAEWCREVAPSEELRRWYDHDPDRFEDFRRRYRRELQDPERAAALRHLAVLAAEGRLTLLTATKRVEISQAAVLLQLLAGNSH
jgi:uncharacterized protein YeaO (DUF488 family)